ncbi:MAG TPA: response regulator [Kiritimatiellae bacterium]|nr:response regulator [Kiritimatiellia bacterium]
MSEHILIVDDDEIVRTGLAQDLGQAGFRTTAVASGREALQVLGSTDVDLVLCDLRLDGIDGMHLLRIIGTRYPHLPVVMITGYGSMDNAIESLKAGAVDYVQKPVEPEELVHRVRQVLHTVELRRRVQEERQRAEERRREFYDRLVRADRMMSLGVLAQGVAYELNNILGPTVGYLDILLREFGSDPQARQLLVQMQEATRKAVDLIRDLQIIGGAGERSGEAVDINAVVGAYLDSERHRRLTAEHPGVRVTFSAGKNRLKLAGSATLLERMVANLVRNAVECIEGRGEVTITTRRRRLEQMHGLFERGEAGEYLVLEVKDSGPGMTPSQLERVFEPFYSTRAGGRTISRGLGLTLVYRIVKDHRGYIDVDTGPGRGTIFKVFLPALESEEAEARAELPDLSGSESVLIVDDHEEQRRVAAALLEDLGYRILTAENGRAAVELFRQRRRQGQPLPDIIVLDMILADDFDGLETYREILKIRPGQKAVIVSGFAETARIVEARRLGAGRYVQKPYTLETLGRAVRAELDSAAAEESAGEE